MGPGGGEQLEVTRLIRSEAGETASTECELRGGRVGHEHAGCPEGIPRAERVV